MNVNMLWLKDTAERALRTWVQSFLGVVIASGFSIPGTVDLSVARKAAIAAIPLGLSVLMSAIAAQFGDPSSASLLRRTGISSGKALGRRPPKNAPALKFADHISSIPEHPISDLAPSLLWPLDHNDTVGCCVVAGLDHYREIVYSNLIGPYTPWSDAELLAFYRTQNPTFRSWSDGGSSRDRGMDIQTFLEYLVRQQIILGFAKVDHSNVEEMKAAIYLGLGIVTGEILTARNMREGVWDYHPGDPQEGGHCTVSVGYTPAERIVSWGALYSVTDAFLEHNVEEAWFVITQAHVDDPGFRAGFDLRSFAAAYQDMTGALFPVDVTPPPVPVPAPPPVAADVDDQHLWAAVSPWVNRRHGSISTRDVAAAFKTWAQDKGL